ncbi:MAG: radical SAM protein [Parvularculaceae bacterium]|nr:radical SAM protein [Parvularculaceae bacterium]
MLALEKFRDPSRTAKGERRADVAFRGVRTLWFNTGTLCNIECAHCYIESSPTNDRLAYLALADIVPFLDELDAAGERKIEIGFTGGEPFMAPEAPAMIEAALERGHRVLVLTNAMRPMRRPRVAARLKVLRDAYPGKLSLRVSLDHFKAARHDAERGAGAFEEALAGLDWLAHMGFPISVAGRSLWNETASQAREGYRILFAERSLPIDASDPQALVLFPEMTPDADPPEISVGCWSILKKSPDDVMCASQRMVVKPKGATAPAVLACTLLPYDDRFELGSTLAEARRPVALNHPYCSSFCVLGGGACSR